MKLLLTNEHGGNQVPDDYTFLFVDNEQILQSPKAYDIGSRDVFEALAPLAEDAFGCTTTRLLVDLNRSSTNPRVFSSFSKKLSQPERDAVLRLHYQPYRREVVNAVERNRAFGEGTFHISIHTFHVLGKNEVSGVDISLLYDPKKVLEHRTAVLLKKELLKHNANLKIRFNFPVTGATDGLPPYLRKTFPETYAGIELLLNQKWQADGAFPKDLKQAIAEAVIETRSRI